MYSSDISEEQIVLIFMIEDYANQEISTKQAAR